MGAQRNGESRIKRQRFAWPGSAVGFSSSSQTPNTPRCLLLSLSSHQHESFQHRCFFFFSKIPEKTFTRDGARGRCFLNIYEPLDRGSWVLHCCPRCPLAARARAPASDPHYVLLSPSHTQKTEALYAHLAAIPRSYGSFTAER